MKYKEFLMGLQSNKLTTDGTDITSVKNCWLMRLSDLHCFFSNFRFLIRLNHHQKPEVIHYALLHYSDSSGFTVLKASS